MKQKFFALGFLLMTSCLVKAQDTSASLKKLRPKTFTVKLQTPKKIKYGFLAGINDSIIRLSYKRASFTDSLIEKPSYKTYNYNYTDIEKVNIRKYGSIGKGIGFGALIGGGVGAIVGLISYHKDPNSWLDLGPGISALGGGILGVIPGIIIGGITGSKMMKFSIRRNKKNFEEMGATILEMALNKNDHVAKDSSAFK